MLESFLSALALVFVIEGIMPFAFPERWRQLLKQVIAKDERALRIMGFCSMVFGVVVLTIIHHMVD